MTLTQETGRRVLRRVRDLLVIVGTAVVLALCVKAFVLEAIHVPSPSMERTVLAGDFLLVNKLAFGPATPGHVPLTRIPLPVFRFPPLAAPRAGDVIVFRFPGRTAGVPPLPGELFVKRIVGLPGQLIEMRGGRLYIEGEPAPPVPGGIPASGEDFGPVRVPVDQYFVLGDNLRDSYDSRSWGCVPAANLVGKAFAVYWSIGADGVRWSRIGTMIQ
jgi:signal peptidase I